MEPAASIIVVNYNAGSFLAKCVAALKAQSFKDFEVFVVDNASSDNSVQQAVASAGDDERFTFLEMAENLGFAAANNHAAGLARAPWLAMLNPDAFPEADWLAALLQATRDNPNVMMFGSMQIEDAHPDQFDGTGDRYLAAGIPWRDQTSTRYDIARANAHNTYPTFAPCAAAALYNRTAFQSVGGFDTGFFCFVEDVDLAFRLRRLGHTCLQVTGARVSHVGGGAGGGGSEFARYHGTRNLIWCFAKNMPMVLLILLTPIHLLVLMVLLARAALRGEARATGRGIADGLTGIRAMLRERRAIKNTAAARDIAAAMDWNPLTYLCRRAT